MLHLGQDERRDQMARQGEEQRHPEKSTREPGRCAGMQDQHRQHGQPANPVECGLVAHVPATNLCGIDTSRSLGWARCDTRDSHDLIVSDAVGRQWSAAPTRAETATVVASRLLQLGWSLGEKLAGLGLVGHGLFGTAQFLEHLGQAEVDRSR